MRVLGWFSCGASSAVACKLGIEKYGHAFDPLYCDTLKFEHPDNVRFMADVAQWIGREITVLRSAEYTDIFDVFDKTGWLVGPAGARCTTELKKRVRRQYERPDDLQVFGLRVDEPARIARFEKENPEIHFDWLLRENNINAADCQQMLKDAGIEIPAMYKLGYKNNNCIGCVKGGAGYWNKIRIDFPESFDRMAKQERKMNVAINKKYIDGIRTKIFLDELPVGMGRFDTEPDWECGPVCISTQLELSLT